MFSHFHYRSTGDTVKRRKASQREDLESELRNAPWCIDLWSWWPMKHVRNARIISKYLCHYSKFYLMI